MEISQKILTKIKSLTNKNEEDQDTNQNQKYLTLTKLLAYISEKVPTKPNEQLLQTSQVELEQTEETEQKKQNIGEQRAGDLEQKQKHGDGDGNIFKRIQSSMSDAYQRYFIGYSEVDQESEGKIREIKDISGWEGKNLEDLNEQIV